MSRDPLAQQEWDDFLRGEQTKNSEHWHDRIQKDLSDIYRANERVNAAVEKQAEQQRRWEDKQEEKKQHERDRHAYEQAVDAARLAGANLISRAQTVWLRPDDDRWNAGLTRLRKMAGQIDPAAYDAVAKIQELHDKSYSPLTQFKPLVEAMIEFEEACQRAVQLRPR